MPTLPNWKKKYWDTISNKPSAVYGADVDGTLTDADVEGWNITKLGTILDKITKPISGVTTPYLYFGMWKSTFAWHTEDMDLYSVNYLHFGEPKTWYAVAPQDGRKFEQFVNGIENRPRCAAPLRHKLTLINPSPKWNTGQYNYTE